MNILSIFSAVFVSLMTGYTIYLVHREKHKLTCMSGMMIAMAVAMVAGLMSGYLLGVFSGVMFLSSGVSIIIGFIIGLLSGQPIGLMAILDGILSGIMSGLMGSMLGVMLKFENPSIMLGILLGLSVIIIGLVILFIIVETNDKFSIDTLTISPFAILSAGAVLIALFLFLYSSDLVKIPTYNTAAKTTTTQTTAQTEVDVTEQSNPKVKMQVTQSGYSPNVIHVKKGVPGCAGN